VIEKTLNPTWDEQFNFYLTDSDIRLGNQITIRVFDQDEYTQGFLSFFLFLPQLSNVAPPLPHFFFFLFLVRSHNSAVVIFVGFSVKSTR
jgi:hypothetical protein